MSYHKRKRGILADLCRPTLCHLLIDDIAQRLLLLKKHHEVVDDVHALGLGMQAHIAATVGLLHSKSSSVLPGFSFISVVRFSTVTSDSAVGSMFIVMLRRFFSFTSLRYDTLSTTKSM